MADLHAMVEAKNKEYAMMVENKDWNNMAKLYSEDCMFMPPCASQYRGRDGLEAYLTKTVGSMDIAQIVQTSDDVCAGGEFLIERGRCFARTGEGTHLEDG